MALVNFGRGTLSTIQAASKSANVLYFATDAQALYLGDHLVTSNVSDASFAANILTINKLDGSKISLDFSDVASAEGVNSLLATLRTSINENAATIADVSSHLAEVASQVTANKVSAADKSIDVTGSAIKANISAVAGNQLSLESDGLYVAKEAAYTGAEAIAVNDHEISLVLDGSSLTQGAGGLKATLKLQKMDDAGEGNASGYQLVDAAGNVYGDAITIAADQFLKEVELDANDDLVFTFITSAGEKTEKVNIAKYIDTYTAGNGINITDKSVSVVVKSGDKYLEVTAEGVATKGIDDAIATAKGEAITDANAYTDGSINTLKNYVDTQDASIFDAAKSYVDTSIASAVSALEEKIEEVQSNVDKVVVYKADGTTIEQSGTDEVTFSVKADVFDAYGAAETAKTEAIADANAYTDSSINALKSELQGAIDDLATEHTNDEKVIAAALNDLNSKYESVANDYAGADATTLESAKTYTNDEIAKLDVTDTAVENQFVTAVSETDGKISVSRSAINASQIGVTDSEALESTNVQDALDELASFFVWQEL